MGIFTETLNKVKDTNGRNRWEQVFGNMGKERDELNPNINPYKKPMDLVPNSLAGGPASSISSNAAIKRLLQAMRSNAPGGWSDDRWEESRHFTGINYIAIHRKATLLQQSEFEVFIKDPTHPKGKRPVTDADPPQGDRLVKPFELVKLLQHPNNEDSWGVLMYNWVLQMDLTGMALTWMVPNKLETPMELYPVPTALAIPQTTINEEYPKGYYRIQPLYPYGPFSSYPSPATSVGAPIPAQWMLRFKYPHPLLRYDGFSPQTAMRQNVDLFESMDRSRWYSMKRSVNPSAVS